MLKNIAEWIKEQMYKRYDKCYEERESEGVAVFSMCGGLAGGDKDTEYLQYECIDCPYLILGYKKKEVNRYE